MEDGEEQFIVEDIVGWEKDKGKLFYHIKWEGYDSTKNTRERAEKFREMDDLMTRFLKKHLGAPIPKNYKGTPGRAADLTASTTTTTKPVLDTPCLVYPLNSTSPNLSARSPNSGTSSSLSVAENSDERGCTHSHSTSRSTSDTSRGSSAGGVHLYIVRGHVGPSIQHLIRHTAEAPDPTVEYRADGFWIHGTTLSQWMDEAVQKWQEQVPAMYWGAIRDIPRQEMFNLVATKGITLEQFHEWLDHHAWDAAQIQLDADMAALSLGPATDLLEQVRALEHPEEERGW
ncbi:hypothetical protein FS749_014251 [Ceratobasidium sp. UAMH 11750]|nr:hypothetical protein FS749_014251 [Ceratobasidium sp. UAMH 11750]